jgi:nucleotide-binding universal stress UspA family protein
MRRILVGYDGSEGARKAAAQAARLARLYHCPLTVLTAAADQVIHEHGVLTPAVDEQPGRQIASEGAALAREHGAEGVEARTSVEAPDDALVTAAAEGYDLIVVGHRGVGALKEFFLGSTAKSVVDRAPCSVLVVR